MALTDQPYFPFYVDDYLSDENLNQCDPASEGIYIRILANMHKSSDYGIIKMSAFDEAKYKQNASKILANDEQKNAIEFLEIDYDEFICIAQKVQSIVRRDITCIIAALIDLIGNGVLKFSNKMLGQKRMIRDGEKSKIRAVAGSKSSNKKAKSEENDNQNGSKALANNEQNSSKIEAKEEQNPVNVFVNVNGIVNEDENEKEEKGELLEIHKSDHLKSIPFKFSRHARSIFNIFIGNQILKKNHAVSSLQGIEYFVRRLNELSKGDEKIAVEILEYSAYKNYPDLYPLKNQKSNGTTKPRRSPGDKS